MLTLTETDILNFIEYGVLNRYKGRTIMNVLEYYAFTDKKPLQLARIAAEYKRPKLIRGLALFNKQICDSSEDVMINLQKISDVGYGNSDRMLNQEELTEIFTLLQNEGYPLTTRLFMLACRRYMANGIEAITRENVRQDFIDRCILSQDKVNYETAKVKALSYNK